MKKTFILLTLICMAHAAFACMYCAFDRGTFDYTYKGNVMSADGVIYTSEYQDNKERTDTTSRFFRSYDKQHKCLVWSHNYKTGFILYRFGVFNGKWRPVEMSNDVIDHTSMEYVYSEDGKLIESRNIAGGKTYYNSNEKEYCSITYGLNKFIREYQYTYYDQRGNDTAIILIDRIKNTTHRIKKIYNPKGYLTEVYENDSLTEYYKYDSAGLPIADSCKMNRDISFEREEAGVKTTYEYYDGVLSSITRHDAKGNEIYNRYFRNLNEENFMKYDEKNKITECKTNYFDEDGTISEVHIALYEKSDNIDLPDGYMTYRHDTLIGINSTKVTRTQNEEIITEIDGEEENGKFNPDTTITRTTFDSKGNILSKKEFKNSKLVNQIKYTYNTQRKLLSIQSGKSITKLPEDIPLGNVTYNKIIYKYDKQNHLQSVTVLDGKTIKITGQYVNDQLVSVKETTDKGTQIIATYTYDSVGNITEETRESNGVKSITKTTFVYYGE
ncbi:MAG: hypothetical protein J6Y78_04980 [Paludibacteraceae bacterium]|nr:hypothetical protein [Paludibacteraceae bacterium]